MRRRFLRRVTSRLRTERNSAEGWGRAQLLERLPLRRGRQHSLPTELFVSLTSYPARFETLHLTVRCLLSQSVAADAVVLWIPDENMSLVPEKVRQLQDYGLKILPCKDVRSFSKIVHALAAYPDATIVTADDDVYYPRDWLSQLVAGQSSTAVCCHRARRIIRNDGGFAPYRTWPLAWPGDHPVLATGVGGVLYPPHCLSAEVTNDDLFLRLCPSADDLWLYWMTRRAGTPIRIVTSERRPVITWPGSQKSALGQLNFHGGENNRALLSLSEHFGFTD